MLDNHRRHQPLFQFTTRYCARTPDPKARQLARTSWPPFAYNPAMSVFHESPKRDKQFLIRLSVDEKESLHKEAEKRDITAAELVRQAINAFVDQPKKKKRKRSKRA